MPGAPGRMPMGGAQVPGGVAPAPGMFGGPNQPQSGPAPGSIATAPGMFGGPNMRKGGKIAAKKPAPKAAPKKTAAKSAKRK